MNSASSSLSAGWGRPAGQTLCSGALADSGTYHFAHFAGSVAGEKCSGQLAGDASAQGSSLGHGPGSGRGGRVLLASELLGSVTQ